MCSLDAQIVYSLTLSVPRAWLTWVYLIEYHSFIATIVPCSSIESLLDATFLHLFSSIRFVNRMVILLLCFCSYYSLLEVISVSVLFGTFGNLF